MDLQTLTQQIHAIAEQFAADRTERQRRRTLDAADFSKLREAGYLSAAIPREHGGLWVDVPRSVRSLSSLLRTLATGDSSVALVSAMHPAVLAYWFSTPAIDIDNEAWQEQLSEIATTVTAGNWWGTITSEPGSGGDVTQTRATAKRGSGPHAYQLSGQKHFGSGSGIMDVMVTTAVPEGESEPDWFFLNVRDVPWDGSAGATLVAEWDGHGMAATQSHAFAYEGYPATRIAWPGNLPAIAKKTGPYIGCLFSSVIAGIVDIAVRTAKEKVNPETLGAFGEVELARAEMEAWLVDQAWEGMVRCVEQGDEPGKQVLQGKTAIAELAESVLGRLCKVIGGGTYSRRSPFGFWYQDVRALGFLRPPWPLAFEQLGKLMHS